MKKLLKRLKNNKFLLLATLFFIFTCVIGYLFYKIVFSHQGSVKNSDEYKNGLTYYNNNPSFHPNFVTSLSWQYKDHPSMNFKRSNANEAWTPPQSKHLDVDNRLLILSQIHFKKIEKLSPPLLNFKVSFQDESTWSGQWDGNLAIWTSGPFKGKGATILDQDIEYFYSGEFWKNKNIEISFCAKRVFGLSKLYKENYTFFIEKNQWFLYDSIGKKLAQYNVLPQIETWISSLCSVKIDQVLDANLFEIDSKADIFEVTYGASDKVKYQLIKIKRNERNYFAKIENNKTLYFSSKTMEQFFENFKSKTLKDLNK